MPRPSAEKSRACRENSHQSAPRPSAAASTNASIRSTEERLRIMFPSSRCTAASRRAAGLVLDPYAQLIQPPQDVLRCSLRETQRPSLASAEHLVQRADHDARFLAG